MHVLSIRTKWKPLHLHHCQISGVHVDLELLFELADWSWILMCAYIKQFLYIIFLKSLSCMYWASSRDWAHRTIVKTSTSTTVKCLRRFLKRWHRLIVWVSRLNLIRGASRKQFLDIISLNSLTCIYMYETWVKPLLPPWSNAVWGVSLCFICVISFRPFTTRWKHGLKCMEQLVKDFLSAFSEMMSLSSL